jgi:hypothetical protein
MIPPAAGLFMAATVKGEGSVADLGLRETVRRKEQGTHTPEMKTEDNHSSHPVAQPVPFAKIGEQCGTDINRAEKCL